jgi:hypothetical protein
MENCSGFIESIATSITSNAIWAVIGGGVIYSIYSRIRLQCIIKSALKRQPENLTALQNSYINSVKISCLDKDTYFPDGVESNLPEFLEAKDIEHFGTFSKWAMLGSTKKSLKVLCYVLKRYEIKRDAVNGMPTRDQAYALLCLGMNIYYQMITISKDWRRHTSVKSNAKDFNATLADYFGVIKDDKKIRELVTGDLEYQRTIPLAPDLNNG